MNKRFLFVVGMLLVFGIVSFTNVLGDTWDEPIMSGPIGGFSGAINATTGLLDLAVYTECPGYTCIPADPANWVVSSDTWTPPIASTSPTINFVTNIPPGYQNVTIHAENMYNGITMTRRIGWLDSELILEGMSVPVQVGATYRLNFVVTNLALTGSKPIIYLYIRVHTAYAGTTPESISMHVTGATVVQETCERTLQATDLYFSCQVLVPINSTLQGYVQIPQDHGQTYFVTDWIVEHSYFQPGIEAEYPYDYKNTPSGEYGVTRVYIPNLRR